MLKASERCFLTLGEWTIARSGPYMYYDGSDQNRRFRYAVPTSSVASYKSNGNLIDAATDGTTFKALSACRDMPQQDKN